MYSLLLEYYIKDPAEKHHLFKAIDTSPCVTRKAEWALRWIDGSESFTERIIAFAYVEGIFFAGSFCTILWLKNWDFESATTGDMITVSRDLIWSLLFFSSVRKGVGGTIFTGPQVYSFSEPSKVKFLDMVDNSPVVAIKGLKVGDFQGVSPSTISRSTLLIKPDLPKAKKLKSWYESEGKGTSMPARVSFFLWDGE